MHSFWTYRATWFTQILPKQNTDFVHFIYWTNILNWLLNLALLHGKYKKRYLAKALTEPIDLMALMSAPNASMQQSGSIDSGLIQWHTGIVRFTALWPNSIQALSDWQRSRPMPVRALIGTPSAGGALGHRLALLCLETVLHLSLTALFSFLSKMSYTAIFNYRCVTVHAQF